jgi:hypothetical protein
LLAACGISGRPGSSSGVDAATGDGARGSSDGTSGGGDGGTTPDAAIPAASFDPSWCSGAEITQQQVLSRFAPAATMATLATVAIDARKRACQDQTGCQGWVTTATVPFYQINWTGSGFTFINGVDFAVPATGQARCTVPGPNCSVTIGTLTSNVYPADTSNPSYLWGVTPYLAGSGVQVGSWSFDPRGNYIPWGATTTTNTCLWGTENGRVYGQSATYTEYQIVVYATY